MTSSAHHGKSYGHSLTVMVLKNWEHRLGAVASRQGEILQGVLRVTSIPIVMSHYGKVNEQ